MDGCHAHLVSPLQLADRLVQLAVEADRAGFTAAATTLVALVYAVLDANESGLHGLRLPAGSGLVGHSTGPLPRLFL